MSETMPETLSETTAPAAEQPPRPQAPEQSRVPSLNTAWISRGLTIRVLAYTAGAHLFAGFLYLLFALGARQGH
ncbi:DUF6126 family protein [Streptomyces sp. SL13]|uniref:DUF6126 family protein n=1 Tax=Streptantibioticus silvisoli TaxID=2705255 RepID=A0AA90H152_9ACTN|nr:DUF6126 family protein [Streptantibioticus silvisoli]MDI5963222.1 DUF6126 family protein [Streptantibioticus silvisoli]MDI5968665.1 DUF6126 family protein [Streptantibioticus silvisoli]